MNRKDLLELKRRFKKDKCTFTRISGCFVNTEKNIVLQLNESFLNLEEDDYFKYLDIAKKVLSGTIGNNILKLKFSNEGIDLSDKQLSLISLKKSLLKDEDLLNSFYKSIIDNYDYPDNYLILVFHDVYDIIAKTTDNFKLDESEEIFEYVLSAICPISLSAPGLSYFEEENKIKSRFRDWVVGPPINGFMYPAFINRSPDIHSLMYYTRNTKDIHPEFMEDILGCSPRETSTLQKEKFQGIVKSSINADEDKVDKIYMEIQENLNDMIEDYKAKSDDVDMEPMILSKSNLQDILIESGIDEGNTAEIEDFYEENFNQDLPLVESLIDGKVLKASHQRKKEIALEKQVDFLKDKIEQINPKNSLDYDIILQVRSDKIEEIKSRVIDGQEYIIIPIDENDKTTISELE